MKLRNRFHRSPALSGVLTATLLMSTMSGARPAAQQPQQQQQAPPETPRFTEETGVTLVSVDVDVRDSSGKPVKDLKPSDFIVTEDKKVQRIDTFSFEEVADAPPETGDAKMALLDDAQQKLVEERRRAATATVGVTSSEAPLPAVTNRRMMLLLFDISSMQPEDLQRAVDGGADWAEEAMGNSDLVAVVTVGQRLNVLTDFTSNREEIMAALSALGASEGDETILTEVTTADTDEAALTADDTTTEPSAIEEFDNDVRLRAMKSLCETIAPIPQKKAIVYFSSGMRGNTDNQIELRSMTNTCNRGNVTVNPIDARGLMAAVAGGGATQRSSGGQSLFTGSGARGMQNLSRSQDTLLTMAADTGGQAFTDSNKFGDAFRQIQDDLSSYYLLGYSSTNAAKDGKFRKIEVRLRPGLSGIKIEKAREGYYAGRSFVNTNRRDREAQLDDQLAAAISSTDLPMIVGTGFFRQANDQFYVPIAVTAPGVMVPVPSKAQSVKLDVKGEIRDEQGRRIAPIRDTVTVEVPSPGAETLAGRQVYYQTGVKLPPGQFSVKIVMRENTGGAVGSFEAPITIPSLKEAGLKVSSVVMSTQMQNVTANAKTENPLVRDGVQLLPNLTRVVGRNQKVYFYYEVYEPALAEQAPHVRTSMAFYRGNVKVFETPVVERTTIDDPTRKAVVFQFEVPAEQFKPGTYTCQINIIDTVAEKGSFPRLRFSVLN
jgi:VWFA-related protein